VNTNTTVLQPSWILSRTTWVSQHQKGKTRKVKPIWIYWSKTYITMAASHHSVFYRPDALPAAQPTASKH